MKVQLQREYRLWKTQSMKTYVYFFLMIKGAFESLREKYYLSGAVDTNQKYLARD